MTDSSLSEDQLLRNAVARIRTGALTLLGATICGVGLFVATIWLVIRGGHEVGPHLGLLAHYYPGYEVSGVGSLVGFFWGAVTGAILGCVTGWIYNRVADLRDRS